jgi:hypothetical protein
LTDNAANVGGSFEHTTLQGGVGDGAGEFAVHDEAVRSQ